MLFRCDVTHLKKLQENKKKVKMRELSHMRTSHRPIEKTLKHQPKYHLREKTITSRSQQFTPHFLIGPFHQEIINFNKLTQLGKRGISRKKY